MKRVVSSSIISVVILLMIAGGFFYYQYYRGTNASELETVPADVAWLISCDPSGGELQQLAKTGFFNGHDSIPVLKSWYNSLISFDSLVANTLEFKKQFAQHPLVVSGHVTGPGSFSLLFITKLSGTNPDGLASNLTVKLLGASTESQTRSYNGVDIHEVSIGKSNQVFAWAVTKGIFVGSFTPYLVEDAIRQQRSGKAPSPATRLQNFMDGKEKGLLAAIRYSGFQRWVNTQINPNAGIALSPLQRVGDWTIAKLELHPNLISFSGTTTLNDSLEFISLFKNQQPISSKIIGMLPSRTAAAIIWGFSDPQRFIDDLGVYLKKQDGNQVVTSGDRNTILKYFKPWIGKEVALLVTQPVSITTDNHYFALINIANENTCKISLSEFATNLKLADKSAAAEESYNGYVIRYLPLQGILSSLFGPLFNRINRFYYTIVDHHLVVANQASALRGFINDIKTKNLLSLDERYHAMENNIPKQSNLFFYCSIPQSELIFRAVAVPQWVNWLAKYGSTLKGWNGLTFSIANQQGVYSSSGCLSYFNTRIRGPHLMWNTKLDTTISIGPFIPGKLNKLVLVQDVKQQLYAIDQEGNIRWKKKMDSNVKGEINAIDYYQNGTEQYLFSTSSFIYMIDSSGNNIGNYPLRLPAGTSNGLSLITFDSSATGKRFYVACTNLRLYGYEINGKPLIGFNTIKLPDIITQPIRIVHSGSEQYLSLIDQNGTCFFIDRAGTRKFTLKEKLSTTEKTIFLPTSDSTILFKWLSDSGKIKVANSDGSVSVEIKLDGDSINATIPFDVNGDNQPDWISTCTSGLQAESSDKIILYRFRSEGTPSNPIAFISGGKSYFSFVSKSAGKFYLLNRDGTSCEGFPQQAIDTPLLYKPASDGIGLIVKYDDHSIGYYLVE